MIRAIVSEGDVYEDFDGATEDDEAITLADGTRFIRDAYGFDWIAVDSAIGDPLEFAAAWDAGAAPMEYQMFAPMYRSGHANLLTDESA